MVGFEHTIPAKNKRGKYNINNDLNISQPLTLEYLEELLNDPSEAFGHGLALVIIYILIKKLYKDKVSISN